MFLDNHYQNAYVTRNLAGAIEDYKAALPEGSLVRLHHICMRVPDWDVFRAEVDRHKWPVAMEGSGTGGRPRWLYIDPAKVSAIISNTAG